MQPDLESPEAIGTLLRALPQRPLAAYDFAEFQRRASQRTRSVRRQALVAGGMLALAVIAVSLRISGPFGESTSLIAPSARVPALQPGDLDSPALPREPAVMRLGTRATLNTLEDRIAQLDDLLSAARANGDAPAALQDLQQQRARLYGAWVQVRNAENFDVL